MNTWARPLSEDELLKFIKQYLAERVTLGAPSVRPVPHTDRLTFHLSTANPSLCAQSPRKKVWEAVYNPPLSSEPKVHRPRT